MVVEKGSESFFDDFVDFVVVRIDEFLIILEIKKMSSWFYRVIDWVGY